MYRLFLILIVRSDFTVEKQFIDSRIWRTDKNNKNGG